MSLQELNLERIAKARHSLDAEGVLTAMQTAAAIPPINAPIAFDAAMDEGFAPLFSTSQVLQMQKASFFLAYGCIAQLCTCRWWILDKSAASRHF